ncbi:MAG: hypothetical protein GC208_10370 [Alphaproteobacteria bacterium]|nr:hypothetical protein [Alphaproteobacteria bacterium]
MADTQNAQLSTSFTDIIRDVSDIYQTLVEQAPALISLVEVDSQLAVAHKHEYADLSLEPEQTTLTAKALINAAVLDVESKSPFEVGAIARFEDKGLMIGDQVRVASIDAALNKITVTRGYGATIAAEIPKDAKIIIVTKPKKEASDPENTANVTPPSINWNATEIFDGRAVVARSIERIHGIPGSSANPMDAMMNFQVGQEMLKIRRRMNAALIYGRRVQRTESLAGTMGGLLQFHEGGNSVDGKGNPINRDLLADAFKACFEGGALEINTALCNSDQAINLARIWDAKLQIVREDKTLGYQVLQVQSELPMDGYVSRIVVDPAFPRNALSLFDRRLIRMKPKRRMQDENSRAPGADYEARRILGEYTAEFRNWKKATVLIGNLSTARLAAK